jgi:2,3-dihydroxybiphenyl 1,2-dioxygenase
VGLVERADDLENTMDIRSLAYIGLNSTNVDAWRKWGTEIIGLGLNDPTPQVSALAAATPKVDGALYFRMDDRRQRIAIYPSDRDELAFMGWELADRIAFRNALEKLDRLNYPYEVASEELALERGVQGMAVLYDPVGYRHEIFYSAYYLEDSLQYGRFPMREGFRTEHGLGHLVLMVPKFTRELDDFATEVLGMRACMGGTSIPNTGARPGEDGRVRTEMYRGHKNKLSHNLVYMEKKGFFGLHHMLIEFKHLDDLGRTYDLVQKKSAYPLIMTLGRHQADTFLSFYTSTPSKVILEVAWNSMEVDNERTVQDRPLHSFVWGLDQVGPVLQDHLRQENGAGPPRRIPAAHWTNSNAAAAQHDPGAGVEKKKSVA